MTDVPRRVFSLLRDNAPMEHSVITNPSLMNQGYGLTFVSMGADTSTPAERLQKTVLYIVLEGEVSIEIHEPQAFRTIVLHPGEVYVRHSGVLIGYRASVPCIFLAQSFRDDVHFVESINFQEVLKLDEWLTLTGKTAYWPILEGRGSLLGNFYGFPKDTCFSTEVKKGIALMICMEGKMQLNVGKRTVEMNQWDAVFLRPSRYSMIEAKALENCRFLRLWRLY